MIVGAIVASVAAAVSAAEIEERPLVLDWTLPKKYAKLEGNILRIKVPEAESNGTFVAQAKFPMAPYLGQELELSVKCRGKGIRKAAVHWWGAKLEMSYKDVRSGKMLFPQCRMPWGDFDGTYRIIAPLYGRETQEAGLCLGLTKTFGEIEFDLSTLRISANRKRYPPKNVGLKASYSDLVRKMPRQRGMQIGALLTEKDLDVLKSWGVNMFHYQLGHAGAPEPGYDEATATQEARIAKYVRDRRKTLDHLLKVTLPWARRNGVRICPVDAFYTGKILENEDAYQAYKKNWIEVATRLKGNEDVIYAYNIYGEPIEPPERLHGYLEMQEDIARAVRAVDPVTPITIQANEMDAASAFNYLNAVDMKDVIYEVHFYEPMSYTHQLVGAGRQRMLGYPQPAANGFPAVDKEFLRKALEPVRRFQLEHGCRIFVGEFSAVIWAKGAAQYLEDAISLFEEYGWDWNYHAFREATLWSVEMEGSDYSHRWPAKGETDRKKVLLKYLKRNATPTAADFGGVGAAE